MFSFDINNVYRHMYVNYQAELQAGILIKSLKQRIVKQSGCSPQCCQYNTKNICNESSEYSNYLIGLQILLSHAILFNSCTICKEIPRLAQNLRSLGTLPCISWLYIYHFAWNSAQNLHTLCVKIKSNIPLIFSYQWLKYCMYYNSAVAGINMVG